MPKAKYYTKDVVRNLEDLPNVGTVVADDLRRIGVKTPEGLRGKDPFALYKTMCKKMGVVQDPCMLDTLMAAVDYVEGAPSRPWWYYTPERKRRKVA